MYLSTKVNKSLPSMAPPASNECYPLISLELFLDLSLLNSLLKLSFLSYPPRAKSLKHSFLSNLSWSLDLSLLNFPFFEHFFWNSLSSCGEQDKNKQVQDIQRYRLNTLAQTHTETKYCDSIDSCRSQKNRCKIFYLELTLKRKINYKL